jgi:GNAT superfamily N-acetyltransferase
LEAGYLATVSRMLVREIGRYVIVHLDKGPFLSQSLFMIRGAEVQDAREVLALAKSFATSFQVDETAFGTAFATILADSTVLCAVAEVDERVVGYILAFSHFTFYANGKVAWVEEVTVNPSFRRSGLGRELMNYVEEWAKERNCRLVALATRRAANFYEALGYEESATYFRKIV